MIKNSARLLELLEIKLGSSKKRNKGEVEFFCPFCHHRKRKLKVNINTGYWHCFVCNTGSKNIISLFKKIHSSTSTIDEVISLISNKTKEFTSVETVNKQRKIILPKESIPLCYPQPSIEYKNAINYLIRRNIDIDKIYKYNLSYCEDGIYRNRIIIPSYDIDGNLNYFVGRAYYENSYMKYKNPPVDKNIFPFELYISWAFPIILVEGVFDAIVIDRNTVPLLGKTINNTIIQKLIEHDTKMIYLCLDGDAIKDIYKICKKLISFNINVSVILLPNKKDPASLGQQEFLKCMENNTIFIDKNTLLKFRMMEIK